MIYRTELFLHVVGVIGAFVGCATLLLGTVTLQRATRVEQVRAIAAPLVAGRRVGLEHISVIDVIIAVSVLLIAVTGLDMARTTGYLRSGWVGVAIATFLLFGPVVPLVIDPRLQRIARATDGMPDGPLTNGMRARVHDRVLTLALQVLMSVLVSLVFLMTFKPSLVGAVIAVLTAIAAGVLWSVSPRVQSLARARIGSGRRRVNDSP